MKKNLVLFSLLGFVGLVCLSGCATIMYTYRLPIPKKFENSDIVAAAVSTFQDNGFTIMLANEKIGIVSTDWKGLTSGFSQGLQKVFAGSAVTDRMKISLSIDSRNGIIKLNPVVESIMEGPYGGAGAPTIKSLNRKQQDFVLSIAKSIAEKLNIDLDRIEIVTEKR